MALVGGILPQVVLAGGFQDTPLQIPQPGGLTGPEWSPEPPSVQIKELGALSMHPPASARLPFALASALVADGPHQDALAARLLNAAPTGTHGLAPAPAAVNALRYALAQIGKPYLWGGNGPNAYDCSGLTQQSYLHSGVLIPRTAAQQATVGVPVRLADLLPGDLLFYARDVHNAATIHHVAMYAGDGMLVHAPQTGEFVHVSPVWLDEYIGAVRLVPAVSRTVGPPVAPMPIGPIVGPTATPAPGPTTGPTTSPTPSTAPTPTPSGTPSPTDPPPTTVDPTPTDPPPTTADPTPTDPPPTTTDPTPTDPPPTTTDPTPTDPTPTTADPTPTDSPTSADPTPTDSPTASDTPTATPSGP